jgi:SAM-dependent methyltransferase
VTVLTVEEGAAAAWRWLPVDDRGYYDAADLLRLSDTELADLINQMEIERYQGWRNQGNWWMDNLLQMEKRFGHTTGSGERGDLTDARIIDWGCGIGLEALQYARAGADVYLADINEINVALAARVVSLMHGPEAIGGRIVIGRDDFAGNAFALFDIIHCVGVLHHIRYPQKTLEQMHALLRPHGELRLMLYSDLAWEQATGTGVEECFDDALRQEFITKMDFAAVPWSDWYDQEKLERAAGEAWHVARCVYLEPDMRFLAAILEPR